MTDGEKLQKVLARAGLGSRRQVESWIASGRVSVGGQVAKLGDRVLEQAEIRVDGRPVKLTRADERTVQILIYNKPENEFCTSRDPEGRRTVFDHLPKLSEGRWIIVGRLDVNTTGLLIFTTDGELANRLMHPSYKIDREYLVRVLGNVTEDMKQQLRNGVELEDGTAAFTDIVEGRGEGANRWYYVCLMEGRNREVRRLWESVGAKVNRLKRVRFGPVFMPSRLKLGRWEYLEQKDVDVIYESVGLSKVKVAQPTKHQNEERQREKRRKARR